MAPSWSTMAYLAAAAALPAWWVLGSRQPATDTGFKSFLKDESVLPAGRERDSKSFESFLKCRGVKRNDASDEPSVPRESLDEEEMDDRPRANVLVLYGTEFGFSREIAEKLAEELKRTKEYRPQVINMADCAEGLELNKHQAVIIPVSTQGDGVAPAEAREFCDWLASDAAPALRGTYFSVCALGDRTYTHFCRCGRKVDARMESLGATRIVERVDVDKEDWVAVDGWISSVISSLSSLPLTKELCSSKVEVSNTKAKWGKSHPFPAKLVSIERLCQIKQDTDKDTICVKFHIGSSGLKYEPGDALGVYPTNRLQDVDDLLEALSEDGNQLVAIPSWHYSEVDDEGSPLYKEGRMSLREALVKCYDIREPRTSLLSNLLEEMSSIPTNGHALQIQSLRNLLSEGIAKNTKLEKYLAQRHVVDIVKDFAVEELPLDKFLRSLRQLQPRLYSISSSQLEAEDEVCLTVAVVRYEALEKDRVGVCSTFLSDRVEEGSTIPIFVSKNPDFRLPRDSGKPIVMIGPGTGLAPFRAFVKERILRERIYDEEHGPAMLFFGCRDANQDYLYGDLLETWRKDGKLELVTAFSRMQKKKVYVQTRLREESYAKRVWDLVSQGGHIYICGDANHMAGEVEQALLDIFSMYLPQSQAFPQAEANKRAVAYLQALSEEHRYERDVWFS